MQFKARGEYPQHGERGELAKAIAEKQQAAQMLADARSAEGRAREASFDAQHRADALRAEASKARADDDAIIASVAGGAVANIIELERAGTKALEAINEAETEREAWKRTADRAEQAIVARTDALASAEDRVKQCASAVLASEIDVEKMLAEAEEAAATIVALRARLMFVSSILPQDDSRRAGIAEFLGRAWLKNEDDDGWRKNPTVAPLSRALASLRHDSEATVEIAP